jgi:hypothetical protein
VIFGSNFFAFASNLYRYDAGVGARMLTLNFEEGNRKETVIAKQVMQDAVTRAVENVTFMPCGPETEVKVVVRGRRIAHAHKLTLTHTHINTLYMASMSSVSNLGRS